jgi:Pro-kumamolisin, activation domain
MLSPRRILSLLFVSSWVLFASVSQAQNHPVLSRHVPSSVASGLAQSLGAVDPAEHLQLALSLPLRNETELDATLADIYNPSSPNFHHYLTPDEFTERFGPTRVDYDAVVAWAASKGFTVTGTTSNRHIVNVNGPVSLINRAFHLILQQYADPVNPSRTFHAPDHEPMVDLAVPLLAISGLDDEQPKVSHVRKVPPNTTSNLTVKPNTTGSGPNNSYLPSDMRAAYYGSGPLTGTGQTVAIFSFDGYISSDLSLYYASTGMSATVPVSNVLVNGYSGACFGFTSTGQIDPNTCDDAEQILDIVNVVGMAPGLSQILFYEGTSSTNVLNKIATDNIAQVVSSSWGGGDFGAASTPIFKQMASQGQTYLSASGDSGQFNSKTEVPPALDPNITQVGGTSLNTLGSAGPWVSETGWSDSGGGYLPTSSGGFAIPSWQQLSGVITAADQGSISYRNSPDIAAEADFDNTTVDDGVFGCCYGGTSFATPRWAGFIALINQQSVANGRGTMGFLNSAIYNIGISPAFTSDLHDITSGINKPTAGNGSGFNAVAGYDLVTGWGSPASALVNALAGPPVDFALAASPLSVSIVSGSSGTTTLTVSPINGFSSQVSLSVTGLPSGVTASFSPTSTSSTSTLQLRTSTTATLGNYTLTVTGTSGSLTHSSTVTLTVTSVTGPWTKVAMEGDTVYLPPGTTYRFGIGNSFLAPATTTSGWTVYVYYTNFGGDPAPGVVKELDVLGNGTGVIVNGVPFGSQTTWTKVAMEGDTVYLPPGTTYRFGIGTSFLPQATTTSGWTVYVYYTNFGGDPAPGVVKELDVLGNGAGVIVNGVPFGSQTTWTKVAMEGDTVYLPPGTTYRFGIGTSFLPQATTTSGWTVYVYYTNFGGDPAPGVVKELDVLGNGAGVIVNGVPFGSQTTWTKVAMEGDTVYLPPGTTYRFGIGTSFLPQATTTSGWTVYVYYTNFGGDPDPGVVKELDVLGNGAGVIVNGTPFQ